MKVLVTGSTGFIGSRTVRRLLERGHTVRCLVRSDRRLHRLGGLPVELVRGDLFDADSLVRAADGCDACIHLAGLSGWDQITGPAVHDVIHHGTMRLLEAVRGGGVRRFVYVSSTAAIDGTERPVVLDERSRFTLDRSGLDYAVAKHAAERAVLDHNHGDFEAVIVSPAETYGADDEDWITAGSIRDVLSGWPAMAVRGGSSVVHVDDVAAGIAAAMERGGAGQRYILGGDNLTIAQIVRLMLDIAALRRPVVVVPFAVLRGAVRACRLLQLAPPIEPVLLAYLSRYWFVDSGKARTELGYRPRPAREALAPAVHWVRDQLAQTPARIASHRPEPVAQEATQ
jgi:dihydroflavonol-4-reductase